MKLLRDVYLYDARGLAQELREGALSEYRAVKHMIVAIILGGIELDIPLSVTFRHFARPELFEYFGHIVVFVIGGVINYYGVWLIYQSNRKGDGKDFFVRFVTLSLPVGIQLLILFLPVGLICYLLTIVLVRNLGSVGMYTSILLFSAAGIAFIAMFYWRMRKYIAIATGYEG